MAGSATLKYPKEAMQDCSSKLEAKIALNAPTLDELKNVLELALKKNFQQVNVDIVSCPDLQAPPFLMTGAGIGADVRIAEVGGGSNLCPSPRTDKFFNLKKICETCEMPKAFIFGPGAGPFHLIQQNCEMVANSNFNKTPIDVANKIAKIVTNNEKGYQMLTVDNADFGLMANLAVSDGSIGHKVLKVYALKRTGEMNYPEAIRKALTSHYGDRLVSLVGIFLLRQGKVRMHVMPDFPQCPFKSHEQLENEWLKFFEMNAPLVCTSVLHSHDNDGYKLRLEHTHCFSEHGDAGHYHYDTTPNDVEYEGYFVPANVIYRIDMA